ncbi:N-acetylneuraminate synthase [Lysinibacillus sp. OL1_EC]|uniref:N-acetylneuraminate synthase n=1 Tax=unclassified Lysinibacillus TaxID=2636778 RepID=UPI00103B3D2D|nr:MULTISPECIES: N-acetylneuraminate synthase [unclassified Lysinibacillus]MCM0626388.1 N-acetylneuraminate synthase [Lysinibacillus sp. OL1_EC]TBV85744.1 N-acetylneuraminate synthase [Lysinibacillus sp. OL1]
MKTYIIAEAGVNHNGSLEMAKELVKVAKEAGADAVKFQTFRAANLVTKQAEQADYQVDNLGEATSQFEMLKKLELSYDEFKELQAFCQIENITFLSTPFDFDSVDFLLDELHMDTIKIPSGELTNAPFIHYIATKQKTIILSTGMATIDEIHEALAFLAFGLARSQEPVEVEQVQAFYQTVEAQEVLKKYITLLHCTTQYPTPVTSINLNAMQEMWKTFQLPIGFSDHSEGIHIPIGAVSMGATVIEKHFTLDKALEGPDHIASLNPAELKDMIQRIRDIEVALGDGIKRPTPIELQNRLPARKSLVAKTSIKAGEIFTKDNLTIKRPGSGIAPSKYWSYIGKIAIKSYHEDELIDE